MSREITMDKPLTDEDRTYLRQRGAYGQALEARVDANYPPDAEALAEYERKERVEAAKMNGAGLSTGDMTSMVAENERLRRELAELRSAGNPPAAANNYNGWSKAELEAEVDRVNAEDPQANLAKGKVADMAAALTAYFAE